MIDVDSVVGAADAEEASLSCGRLAGFDASELTRFSATELRGCDAFGTGLRGSWRGPEFFVDCNAGVELLRLLRTEFSVWLRSGRAD